MKRGRVGFLKPRDDNDDTEPGFQEDRSDLDTNSQTSFIYNPNHHQDLERQRTRLPIAAYKNNLLYLLENYQVTKPSLSCSYFLFPNLLRLLLWWERQEAGSPLKFLNICLRRATERMARMVRTR